MVTKDSTNLIYIYIQKARKLAKISDQLLSHGHFNSLLATSKLSEVLRDRGVARQSCARFLAFCTVQ